MVRGEKRFPDKLICVHFSYGPPPPRTKKSSYSAPPVALVVFRIWDRQRTAAGPVEGFGRWRLRGLGWWAALVGGALSLVPGRPLGVPR